MPTAAPMMLASEIGVSMIAFGTEARRQRLAVERVLPEHAAAPEILAERDDARVGVHRRRPAPSRLPARR